MPTSVPKESASVLIVDDDKTLRLLMRESLEQAGFSVEEAADGRQAVALFMHKRPDLVLLDVMMPDMDGIHTCSALRKLPGGANIPIIIVTGLENVDFITQAYEAEATDFITKPLNWTLLSHRVRYVLRASQALEDLSRSQGALQEREERLKAIFETASDLIVTLDLACVFTSVNRAVEVALGFDRADLIGKPLDHFLAPTTADQMRGRLERGLRHEPLAPDFELEVKHSDGSLIPFRAKARFLKEDGQRVGLVCVLRDISHERALELQRAEFLSMLTHDIRNPMSVISGCTELLLEAAQARDDQLEEDVLQRIHSNARTVRSLVTNYLDCSKIEAGCFTLSKQSLTLNDLLQRVIRQYETEAQRQSLTISTHLQNCLPLCEGDILCLERIFTNLIHNAIKFTPEGGQIMIRSQLSKACIVVSVSDTGPGIPSTELAGLFQKYHRALQTRSTQGVGLGLFIAQTLTEAHGGKISVTSIVGQGTCFRVELPVAATPDQAQDKSLELAVRAEAQLL